MADKDKDTKKEDILETNDSSAQNNTSDTKQESEKITEEIVEKTTKAEVTEENAKNTSETKDTKTEEEAPQKSEAKIKEEEKTAKKAKDDSAEERKIAPASIKFTSKAHPDSQWFVVHTYSGHERKVALTLRERVTVMDLQDKINEVLIPTQKKIVIKSGKKKEVDERMFPGYILVHAVINDNVWHAIRSTPGVTGFVGIGNRPTPLSNKEVQSIVKFMKLDTPKFEVKHREGDSVKITEGAFKDFVGKVNKVMTEQGRLEILVSVFDRETPVEVDFTQVVPE